MLQGRCGYLSRCLTRRCNSRTAPSNSRYTGWTRGSPSLASSVIGTMMSRWMPPPGGGAPGDLGQVGRVPAIGHLLPDLADEVFPDGRPAAVEDFVAVLPANRDE
jgi:hypothetical protein